MSDNPRTLEFKSLDDVINQVQQLARGNRALGQWSLPQTAWHLGAAIDAFVKPVVAGTTSSPQQQELKRDRLDKLLAFGQIPPGLPTSPGLDPRTEAPPLDDSTVDRFIAGLKKLRDDREPQYLFGRFGIVSADEFRRFILIHSAHHLKNLVPTA